MTTPRIFDPIDLDDLDDFGFYGLKPVDLKKRTPSMRVPENVRYTTLCCPVCGRENLPTDVEGVATAEDVLLDYECVDCEHCYSFDWDTSLAEEQSWDAEQFYARRFIH